MLTYSLNEYPIFNPIYIHNYEVNATSFKVYEL
jgi:hypothetical protein